MIQAEDFAKLFIKNTPLIDTRSPLEFAQGSFPFAKNLPLMSDKQRELVGICYKNQGQQSALDLGHKLVQGQLKQARLEAWLQFIKNNPHGALFCFRGGLRSQISQKWIFDSCGINYPRITGGYKALRRFLLNETESIISTITPLVLGGQTGCGKTLLLKKITQKVDLEGLANHRGSAFGGQITPQPSQIDFENALAIALIKRQNASFLAFEDEGKNIGALNVPPAVQSATSAADLIILTASLDERVEISLKAYVAEMLAGFGFADFSNYWLMSLLKIQKRLGSERHKKLHNLSQNALQLQQQTGAISGFRPIVKSLLVDYYDPMYDYQIKNKSRRIKFTGNAAEVLDYLQKFRV
ncbi:MAG: tRNA 2-selenouridine(34) synthase MnmH [Candidatus Thioglobus sp.]|nr:tRNA 2-selenouridine(34) synthase MnmH [Candidatus Thioglobus sp.]